MDETEAHVLIDLSGRPYSVFEGDFVRQHIGDYPTEMTPHIFRSLADSLGAAIHVRVDRRQRSSQDRGLLQGVRPRASAGGGARGRGAKARCRARRACCECSPSSISAYGNIGSIQIALAAARGSSPCVTADPAAIRAAERVVLPGVGAAGYAMGRIDALGLRDTLTRRSSNPCLGICLGMQLLFDGTARRTAPTASG